MPLSIDFVRLTIKEGAKNRFLTCLALDPPADKKEMGQLFALVELTRQWFPTAQIGQSLIGLFSRSYYRGQSTSDLENFEQAIASVNQLLTNLSQQGETEWIGHLHAGLILLNESSLHLATTGDLPVWLFRNNHLQMITEPNDPSQLNPTKTFATITSGSLIRDDRLLIGNSSIFETITKPQLTHYLVSGQTVYNVGLLVAKDLKKQRLKEAIGLIVTLTTPQSIEHPQVIYLDQPIEHWRVSLAKHAKYLTARAMRGLKTSLHFSAAGAKKFKTTLTPIAHQSTQQILKNINRLRQKIPIPQKKSVSDDLTANQSLIGQTIFTVHNYQGIGRFAKLIKPVNLARRLRNWPFGRFSKATIQLTLALALIVILIVSIAWQKKQSIKNRQRQSQEQVLGQATKRFQDGKTALVFNNKKEAALAFTEAIEKARSAGASPWLNDRAKAVITDSQLQLDRLINATRFNDLKPIVQATGIDAAFVFEGKIYTLDHTKPDILEHSQVESTPQLLVSLTNPSTISRPILVNNLLYLVTAGTIEQVNLSNHQVTVFTNAPKEALANANDLAFFGANLYILEPIANKISKFLIQGESLASPVPYLRRGDVKDAVSLTIDGAVYVLKKDGQVIKFSRGEKQDFKLNNIPKPNDTIGRPIQIDTDQSTSSIFIADAKVPRILEFDKTGQYLHQFILPADQGELKSIFYQFKGRQAWAVIGQAVFELNL